MSLYFGYDSFPCIPMNPVDLGYAEDGLILTDEALDDWTTVDDFQIESGTEVDPIIERFNDLSYLNRLQVMHGVARETEFYETEDQETIERPVSIVDKSNFKTAVYFFAALMTAKNN